MKAASYCVFCLNVAVFFYVQLSIFSNTQECKRRAPEIYIWLVSEIIIFYLSLTFFIGFSSFFAYMRYV